jgi:3-oxoacyl-[acyl-carrier protein] reductase
MNAQVAIVTGGSRGIGRAIAERLAADGFRVIATATTAAGAAGIDATLSEAACPGAGRVLDVSDVTAIESFLKQVNEEFGTPTVLVNNAGITRDNLLMRMKDEEWDGVIRTNLSSIYHLSKGCIRGMMKAKAGRIVNIASVVGSTGNAGQTNYAAAKAGMIGFTESLAKEVGSRGITVNAVAPGFIDTDMTSALPDEHRAVLLANIALGRLGRSEEIAAAVGFLVSDQAAYITGETLHVNGGMFMP